jgi:hypothetical protein
LIVDPKNKRNGVELHRSKIRKCQGSVFGADTAERMRRPSRRATAPKPTSRPFLPPFEAVRSLKGTISKKRKAAFVVEALMETNAEAIDPLLRWSDGAIERWTDRV